MYSIVFFIGNGEIKTLSLSPDPTHPPLPNKSLTSMSQSIPPMNNSTSSLISSSSSKSDTTMNTNEFSIRCRKCRRILANSTQIVKHTPSSIPTTFSHRRSAGIPPPLAIHYHNTSSLSHSRESIIKSMNSSADLPHSLSSVLQNQFYPHQYQDNQYHKTGGLKQEPSSLLSTSSLSTSSASASTPLSSLSSSSCTSYYLEPMEWMSSLNQIEGKLNCPKCSCRLGSWNWSGLQCSCGEWVTPAFGLTKSKVDLVSIKKLEK